MKTLLKILALQLFISASAFAALPGEESESGLQKTSVAVAQSNFTVSPAEEADDAKARADEILGGGSGASGSSRSATVSTPRPTGNEWGLKGPASR